MLKPKRTRPTPSHCRSMTKIWDFEVSRVTPDGPVPSNLSIFQLDWLIGVSTIEPVTKDRCTTFTFAPSYSKNTPLSASKYPIRCRVLAVKAPNVPFIILNCDFPGSERIPIAGDTCHTALRSRTGKGCFRLRAGARTHQ